MTNLFTREVATFRAPVLIHHLDGAMDAGMAGRLVAEQLRAALNPTRIGTFNTDELLDYRSHRPTVWVENWQVSGVAEPEIALDLVHDLEGTPILLLHGPEPDFKWGAFRAELAKIIEEAGVELTISSFGVPVPVPHTRPTPVHAAGTAAAHMERPSLIGAMQTAASLDMLIDVDQTEREGDTLQLVSFVPFYLGQMSCVDAAAATIRHLSEVTGLKLPVGDLEAAATQNPFPIDELIETAEGEESRFGEYLALLESQYDAAIPATPTAVDEPSGDLPTGEEIADAVQDYLASLSQQAMSGPTSPARRHAENGATPVRRAPRHRREQGPAVQHFLPPQPRLGEEGPASAAGPGAAQDVAPEAAPNAGPEIAPDSSPDSTPDSSPQGEESR
ncbi:MAG: PAC2 family protein [Buchananella hordeovulneris]|nr:PAC2 family protein [Buchananella hordeovulneris]